MLPPENIVVKFFFLSYDGLVKRKFFLAFVVFSLLIFKPQTAFACDDFNSPSSAVAGETFPVTVQGLIQGYSYTLYYIPQDGSYNPRSLPPVADGPKLAEGKTLTFNGKIPSRGDYKLWVSGTNRVSGSDQCNGIGLIHVGGRWAITSANGCTEVPTGGFATKEECETATAKVATPTPPPHCLEGKDKAGNSTTDKTKMESCTKIDTALGAFDITPTGFIRKVFALLLSLSGGVAIILVMISGYRLMSSQGNPEKVQAAREQLTSAIVGLLFIIFSVTILQIIGVDILHIPGLKP